MPLWISSRLTPIARNPSTISQTVKTPHYPCRRKYALRMSVCTTPKTFTNSCFDRAHTEAMASVVYEEIFVSVPLVLPLSSKLSHTHVAHCHPKQASGESNRCTSEHTGVCMYAHEHTRANPGRVGWLQNFPCM